MMLRGQNSPPTFFFPRIPRPGADCRKQLCCQQTLCYYRDITVQPLSAASHTVRLGIALKAPEVGASLTERI